LLNLVVNARTHTPVTTPVRVGAQSADGHIVFDATDQGPGIDPALLPTVLAVIRPRPAVLRLQLGPAISRRR
jgi:K+-sensing histidine kinase KdpD